jgi:hypothetical protein
VPDEVKEERWHRLMGCQQAISTRRLRRKVGTRQQVIIDEVGAGARPSVVAQTASGTFAAKGRSRGDAPQRGHAAAVPAWQAYQLKYHTSSEQLVELARKARPTLLVLYHQIYLFDTSTRDDLLREMSAYKGDFVSGLDLDIY